MAAAGVVSVGGGLLALVWFPDVPDQPQDACAAPPCWGLDVDGASAWVVLPFMAHLVLLGLALAVGGFALVVALVGAVRAGGRSGLAHAGVAVVGPLVVLVGGEVVPHLVNPCTLPELVGSGPPGFCDAAPEGADVPSTWHALDHAVVGFLPLALVVAWWWRRQVSRERMSTGHR